MWLVLAAWSSFVLFQSDDNEESKVMIMGRQKKRILKNLQTQKVRDAIYNCARSSIEVKQSIGVELKSSG